MATGYHMKKKILQRNMSVIWPLYNLFYFQSVWRGFVLDPSLLPPLGLCLLLRRLGGGVLSRQR